MASINIYLKKKIKKVEGFKDLGTIGKHSELYKTKIYRRNSRLYLQSSDLKEPIPEVFAEFVEEISFHDILPKCPVRERGVYKHRTAEAELEFYDPMDKKSDLKLEVWAKNLEDIRELALRIKVGKIRPEESFEGEQNGMSKAELGEKLKNAQRNANVAEEKNRELTKNVKALKNELDKVIDELKKICQLKSWSIRKNAQALLSYLTADR